MNLTITPKFQALPSAKQNSQTNSTVSLQSIHILW